MGDPAEDDLGGTPEYDVGPDDLGGTPEQVDDGDIQWAPSPRQGFGEPAHNSVSPNPNPMPPVSETASEREHMAGLAEGDYPRGNYLQLASTRIRGSRTGAEPPLGEFDADNRMPAGTEGHQVFRRTLREDRTPDMSVGREGQVSEQQLGDRVSASYDIPIPEGIQQALRVGGRLFGGAAGLGRTGSEAIARGIPDRISPEAAALGYEQAATFGFADELGGVGNVLAGGAYREGRDEVRHATEVSAERAPVSAAAGQVLGMAATAPLIPMGGGAGAVGRTAVAAGTGAAIGGAASAGMTEAELGSDEFNRDVGVGTVAGGVLGGAVQGAVEGAPAAVRMFLGSDMELAYNRALNDAVTMGGFQRSRSQLRQTVGGRRADKQAFIDKIERLRSRGVRNPQQAVERLDDRGRRIDVVFDDMQAGVDAQQAAPPRARPPERVPEFGDEFAPEVTGAASPSAMERTAVDDFGSLDTIAEEALPIPLSQARVPRNAPQGFSGDATTVGGAPQPTPGGIVGRIRRAQNLPQAVGDVTAVEGAQGPQLMGRPPDGSAPMSGPARQALDQAGSNIAADIRSLAESRGLQRGEMPAAHGATEGDALNSIAAMFEQSGERGQWTIARLRGHLQQLGDNATWRIGAGGDMAGEEVRRGVYGIVRNELQKVADAVDPALGAQYSDVAREIHELIPFAEGAYNQQIGDAVLRKVPLTSNIMAAGVLGSGGSPGAAAGAALANNVFRRAEPRIARAGWSAAYQIAQINPTALGPSGRTLTEAARRGPAVFATAYFMAASRDPSLRLRVEQLETEQNGAEALDAPSPRDTPMGETIP